MDKERIKNLQGQKFDIEAKALSVNAEEYTVDFVLSTEDIDRHGDIVDQASWKLDSFLSNPVLLEQHKSWEFSIGRFESVEVEDDPNLEGKQRLVGRAKFAVEEYERARVAFDLVKGGFMNTVSVGFIPHLVEYDEDQDALIMKENELLEVSLVSVPSNRMALAKARGIDVEVLEDTPADKMIKAKEEIAQTSHDIPAKRSIQLLNQAIRRYNRDTTRQR